MANSAIAVGLVVSLQGSGTQTATLTTEHTLLDIAIAGMFQLEVDMINMAAGDYTELRIYEIILASGTRRVAFFQSYAGAQPADDIIKVGPFNANDLTDSGSLRFTLKQTVGTGRNYPWKVMRFS